MNTWGIVTATSFQGEISSSSQGYRRSLDREVPEEMDFFTQFDVASLTKIIFTTNMLMLSVDRNLLNIEDPVHKYLLGWKVADKEKINFASSDKMLVTGGGAFNSFLIERMQANVPIQIEVPTQDVVKFKEALVIAFMGVLRMRNEVNVLKSVTGAAKDSVGGAVYRP